MSRTPIPRHLIHRPEEVERNATRFDHLCSLAEEVALPVVREALRREAAATGAEVLTEEAQQALEALAEDAAILEGFDEKQLLRELRISLNQALPPLDEEECRDHARDLSQVLMGAWVESLRSAGLENKIVVLTDHLLPYVPSHGSTWVLEQFGVAKPTLPQDLIDATAAFAVNEEDVAGVMATLRAKLFPEVCLLDLPFDLVLIGAPGKPVMMMSRPYYERLIEIKLQLEEAGVEELIAARQHTYEPRAEQAAAARFTTDTARRAAEILREPLSADRYWYLKKVASPKSEAGRIATEVRRVLKAQ